MKTVLMQSREPKVGDTMRWDTPIRRKIREMLETEPMARRLALEEIRRALDREVRNGKD